MLTPHWTLQGIMVVGCLAMLSCRHSGLNTTTLAIDPFAQPDDPSFSAALNLPNESAADCPNWAAGTTIEIGTSATLPAGCRYERVTLRFIASDIDFDCNGAILNGLSVQQRNDFGVPYTVGAEPAHHAIQVRSRADDTAAPLQNITLRNCTLLNYIQGVDIRLVVSDSIVAALRAGLLDESELRALAPHNIQLHGFTIADTHGSGVYVHNWVTEFTFANSSIRGAGGAGLYLDASSRGAVIRNSVFEGNGYSRYSLATRTRTSRPGTISRREGIAVDGSSQNLIERNRFSRNGDGGVYLYKNCWEHANEPDQIPRPEGAHRNRIANNQFNLETTAIWVAERADRDLAAFECGDPLLFSEGDAEFYRDHAAETRIEGNVFADNTVAVKVMDNGALVLDNIFSGSAESDLEIGSRIRTQVADPVRDIVVEQNVFGDGKSPVWLYATDMR